MNLNGFVLNSYIKPEGLTLRKTLIIWMVMLIVMSFASSVSARALGYGIIFDRIDSDGTIGESSKPFPGNGRHFQSSDS